MKRLVTVLQFQIDNKKKSDPCWYSNKKNSNVKFAANEISTAYFHVTQRQKE